MFAISPNEMQMSIQDYHKSSKTPQENYIKYQIITKLLIFVKDKKQCEIVLIAMM